MDPATAIGTAAAVLQFVQFSLGVLEICRQIRDDVDSATTHNKELDEAIQTAEKFRKDHAYGTQTASSKKLAAIAQECAREAEELVNLLKYIRGAGKAKALYRALKERKSIEKLHNRLKERERQLNHMLVQDTHSKVGDVRGDIEKLAVASQTQSDELRQAVTRTQKSLHGHVYRSGRQVRGDIARLEKTSQANTRTTMKTVNTSRTVLQGHIDRSERKIIGEMVGSRRQAEARNAMLQRTERHQQLLTTLSFPDMNQRRSNIKDAWPDTYRWIFDMDIAHKTHTWANFDFWLRRSSSVYWISGKAASGKSTLMAYIASHDRTQQALREWSQRRELCVASFYFWRPGSEMQKSVDGCLRSLLHQICTKVPTVVEAIFGLPGVADGLAPETKNLVLAIETAVTAATNVRFCVFIDGLDEFTGRYDDLVNIIFRLQQLNNIKFCVASRPETNLSFRLSACKQLRLQDLNYSDIRTFVQGRLKTADIPCTSGDTDYNGYWNGLASQIIHAADGVFLWAAIVTQSLIQGARSGDTADILKMRLEETPKELTALFQYMVNNIDPVHKASLAFYLQAMKLDYLLNSEENYFVNICNLTAARAQRELSSYSYQEFAEMCRQTETQILAQSAGLLDVRSRSYEALGEFGFEKLWVDSPRRFGLYPEVPLSEASDGHQSKRHSIPALPYPECLGYEMRVAEWVHRSAYDFVFLSDSNLTSLIYTEEKRTMQWMFRGIVSYYAYAPSFELWPSVWGSTATQWRLGQIHHICGAVSRANLDGDDIKMIVKAAIDESYRVSLTIAPCEFLENTPQFLYNSKHNRYQPIRAFWESCCDHGLWDRTLLLTRGTVLRDCGNDLLVPCLYYALCHAHWRFIKCMPPQDWLATVSFLGTRIETLFCRDARFRNDNSRTMAAFTGGWGFSKYADAEDPELSFFCMLVPQESTPIDGLDEPVMYSLLAQIAWLWILYFHQIDETLGPRCDPGFENPSFSKDLSDSLGSISTRVSARGRVISAPAIEHPSVPVYFYHTEMQDRVEDRPWAYAIQSAEDISQTLGKLLGILDFSIELGLSREQSRRRRLRLIASGDLWLAWVLRRRLSAPSALQRWQCDSDLEQRHLRDISSSASSGLLIVCLPHGFFHGDVGCQEEKGAIILNVCSDALEALLDSAKLCPKLQMDGVSDDCTLQFLCSQRQTQDIVRMVLDQIKNSEQLTATEQLLARACVRMDLPKWISEASWWEYIKAEGLDPESCMPSGKIVFPRLTKDA